VTTKCESGACIHVDLYEGNVRIRSTVSFTTCQATNDEWADFLARVKAGEFDYTLVTSEAVAS